MLNLAPIKYSKVFKFDGGPIEKIIWSQTEIFKNVIGYEASAYLCSELRPQSIPLNKIYGNPDGTGSDQFQSAACYKAISEALERWAYYETALGKQSEEFGFDLDPSTNGLAAYPGLSQYSVKKFAYFEALERWAIGKWWSEQLGSSEIYNSEDISFIEIFNNNKASVVICWFKFTNCENQELVAYGFAASGNIEKALLKAQIELFRNKHILQLYYKNRSRPELNHLNIQEKRLIWFSANEGYNQFLEKIRRTQKLSVKNQVPIEILSKKLNGPWSQFSQVCRVLFKDQNLFYTDESNLNIFSF